MARLSSSFRPSFKKSLCRIEKIGASFPKQIELNSKKGGCLSPRHVCPVSWSEWSAPISTSCRKNPPSRKSTSQNFGSNQNYADYSCLFFALGPESLSCSTLNIALGRDRSNRNSICWLTERCSRLARSTIRFLRPSGILSNSPTFRSPIQENSPT